MGAARKRRASWRVASHPLLRWRRVRAHQFAWGRMRRLLALAAAIWHNWKIDAQVKRSLTAYDH